MDIIQELDTRIRQRYGKLFDNGDIATKIGYNKTRYTIYSVKNENDIWLDVSINNTQRSFVSLNTTIRVKFGMIDVDLGIDENNESVAYDKELVHKLLEDKITLADCDVCELKPTAYVGSTFFDGVFAKLKKYALNHLTSKEYGYSYSQTFRYGEIQKILNAFDEYQNVKMESQTIYSNLLSIISTKNDPALLRQYAMYFVEYNNGMMNDFGTYIGIAEQIMKRNNELAQQVLAKAEADKELLPTYGDSILGDEEDDSEGEDVEF